jgi:hypothetical protein
MWTVPGPCAPRLGDGPKRTLEIVDQHAVIGRQDVTPSDNHDIGIDIRIIQSRRSADRPETPLDPVAFRRMPDPFGDRQAEAQAGHGSAGILAAARAALDRHPLRMEAAARGRRNEIRSFRQAPDRACARVAHRAALDAGLRRKALAAMGATSGDDLAATLGRHARAEAMAALANQLARLIGPLHGSSPVEWGSGARRLAPV